MGTIYREEFELKEIPYDDKTLGISITLYTKGVAEFQSDGDSVCIAEAKDILPGFMLSVLGLLAQEGCGYGDIHRQDIFPATKKLFDKTNKTDLSFEIKKVYFTEIYPSDADYPRIIEAIKENKTKEKNISEKVGVVNEASDDRKAAKADSAAKIWICPKCGKQSDTKFCSSCGTSREKQAGGELLKKCPSCGKNLAERPDIRFCPVCGTSLNKESGAQTEKRIHSTVGEQTEKEIIRGKCNWIINPLLIQNGNAILTDQRFIYKKGSIFSAPMLLTATVKNLEGESNFELSVKNIVKVSQGRQGIARTIVLHTSEKQYTCNFLGNTDAFWNAFTMVLGIPH